MAENETNWPRNPADEELELLEKAEAFEAEEEQQDVADPDALEDSPRDMFMRAVRGKRVRGDVSNPESATHLLLTTARFEAARALEAVIDADLTNPAGIEKARTAQSEVLRYMEMAKWLTEAMNAGRQAEIQIKGNGNG